MKTFVVYLIAAAALAAALPAAALAAEAAPWQLKNPLAPQQAMRADLLAVCALDGGTAWVAGAQNALYFSHDGGASWAPQTSGAPRETVWRALQFADRQHGYLAGGASGRGLLYATADGGATWTPRSTATAPLLDLKLAASGRLWALAEGGVVLASSDGGASWRRSAAGAAFSALDFASPTLGVAVGPRGVIMRSCDGGATWRRALALTVAGLTDVVMQSTTQGFAVGEKGLVLRTQNGGLTWWRQATPAGLGDCLAVAFASARRGWIALSSGKVLGTSDGGCTWRLEGQGSGAALRALGAPPVAASGSGRGAAETASTKASSAPTPYRAFAAGDGGTVVKYTELGTESHGNGVWLVPQTAGGDPLPTGMSFALSDVQYTSGQPYDGWSTSTASYSAYSQTYPYFIITIQAGRSGSTPPAQWFTSVCGGAEIGNYANANTPATANFAVSGTLSANATYNLAFAQSNEQGNNWWIGGPGFSIVTPSTGQGLLPPAIATPDSAWLFTGEGGPNNNTPSGSGNYVFVMTPN